MNNARSKEIQAMQATIVIIALVMMPMLLIGISALLKTMKIM
jgi:hypothetical protein